MTPDVPPDANVEPVQGTIAEDGGARLASPFQRLERLAPRSF